MICDFRRMRILTTMTVEDTCRRQTLLPRAGAGKARPERLLGRRLSAMSLYGDMVVRLRGRGTDTIDVVSAKNSKRPGSAQQEP